MQKTVKPRKNSNLLFFSPPTWLQVRFSPFMNEANSKASLSLDKKESASRRHSYFDPSSATKSQPLKCPSTKIKCKLKKWKKLLANLRSLSTGAYKRFFLKENLHFWIKFITELSCWKIYWLSVLKLHRANIKIKSNHIWNKSIKYKRS